MAGAKNRRKMKPLTDVYRTMSGLSSERKLKNCAPSDQSANLKTWQRQHLLTWKILYTSFEGKNVLMQK